jgi:hypothetical protein
LKKINGRKFLGPSSNRMLSLNLWAITLLQIAYTAYAAVVVPKADEYLQRALNILDRNILIDG